MLSFKPLNTLGNNKVGEHLKNNKSCVRFIIIITLSNASVLEGIREERAR